MARARKCKWSWDPQKDEAAVLIAAAESSNAKIAKKLEIAESTIYDWLIVPEFIARIEESRARIREQITQRGIAVVENRVARKNADWERLKQIQEAREAFYSQRAGDYPGIDTGLILHDQKGIGSGDNFEIVDVYRLDTSLLNALNALEDGVAIELGQRVQKQEIEMRDVSIAEELDAKLGALAKRFSEKDASPASAAPTSEAAQDAAA